MAGAFEYGSAAGGTEPKKWVSGSSYPEGRVVWSPTDYQYYMRKVAGAGTTDPVSDTTNWQPTGERATKSIQRGSTAISTTSLSVTISSVVTAKTEVRFGGFTSTGTDNTASGRVFLSNSTTLVIAMNTAGPTTIVSWELTERY